MILRILEEKKKRYDELHCLLADEKIVANKAEYQAYAKEVSALTPLINEYNLYRKILRDIDETEKVLKEKGHDKEFIAMAEEELHSLKAMSKVSESKLEEIILEKESGGDKDIIMEIRAGTGGIEASLFAADLLRMYSKYAAKNGWKAEPIDASTTEKGGYKEVIFSI
ncbi:MAG: PCRF domain-containing protein, partial [Candidatus Omnitrophica bacterium]|nr:PCRF domain-containing protein [Candidatus Omnitrophota bacterium]